MYLDIIRHIRINDEIIHLMKYIFSLFIVFSLIGAGCLTQDESNTTDVDTAVDLQPEANIVVDLPLDQTEISSPITVTGKARVFENVVNWMIRDINGKELSSGYFGTDAQDVGLFGEFEERIYVPVVTNPEIILQVFNYSAKDGSVENLVERRLFVKEMGRTSVNVYFTDPDAMQFGDCSAVDFEKRTVNKTVNVAELSMLELLKGPTAQWARTEMPFYTSLDSVSVTNKKAIVKFTSPNIAEWNGGSCHVVALRAQIEKTLLQFDSVESVEIFVNGKTSESGAILQP